MSPDQREEQTVTGLFATTKYTNCNTSRAKFRIGFSERFIIVISLFGNALQLFVTKRQVGAGTRTRLIDTHPDCGSTSQFHEKASNDKKVDTPDIRVHVPG